MSTPSVLLRPHSKFLPRIPPRKINPLAVKDRPSTSKEPSAKELKDELRRLKRVKKEEEKEAIMKRKEKREKEKARKLAKEKRMAKQGLGLNGNPLPLTSEELAVVAARRDLEAKESLQRQKQHSVKVESMKQDKLDSSSFKGKEYQINKTRSNLNTKTQTLVQVTKNDSKESNALQAKASSSKVRQSTKRPRNFEHEGEENKKQVKKIKKRARSNSSGDSDEIEHT